MVRLHELPLELLEQIMQYVVTADGKFTLGYGWYPGHAMSLRLLHSRITAALNPLLFARYRLEVHHYRYNPCERLDDCERSHSEGLYRLLTGNLGQFCTKLDFVFDDAENDDDEAEKSNAAWQMLLECIFHAEFPRLEKLKLRRPYYDFFQEPVFARGLGQFCKLKYLSLGVGAFIAYLPYIACAAPNLQTVRLDGECKDRTDMWTYLQLQGKDFPNAIAEMQPFVNLEIWRFGRAWMQEYLAVVKPRARHVYIAVCEPWEGNFTKHVSAFESIMNYSELSSVAFRYHQHICEDVPKPAQYQNVQQKQQRSLLKKIVEVCKGRPQLELDEVDMAKKLLAETAGNAVSDFEDLLVKVDFVETDGEMASA